MDWLLSPENPSVRFWALQDLLELERTHPDVAAAQDAVMESTPVRAILSAQQPEGHWENPRDMYLPKYTASTHSLLVLAELGAGGRPRSRGAWSTSSPSRGTRGTS